MFHFATDEAARQAHLKAKFMKKVDKDTETQCWTWTGGLNKNAPFFSPKNRGAKAVSLELFKGEAPAKYRRLACTCGNPLCVNPDHLFILGDTLPSSKAKAVPQHTQPNKRKIQTLLNERLIDYLTVNSDLKGGVILLSGPKVAEATRPYFKHELAERALIVEQDLGNHAIIAKILRDFEEDYPRVNLWPKAADILSVVPQVNKAHGERWRGFDLDFDGSVCCDRLGRIIQLVESIQAPAWWLRVTSTVRPYSAEKVRDSLDCLARYICSKGSTTVEDIATGPVYAYCDSSAMQTMQVICKRR